MPETSMRIALPVEPMIEPFFVETMAVFAARRINPAWDGELMPAIFIRWPFEDFFLSALPSARQY